nr:ABC transporter ATP-binding protein [Brevibacterium sp. ACRRH]
MKTLKKTKASGLTVQGICAGYSTEPVVQGVDLRLNAGEVTALVGPNGSGKSTLLRALSGLLPAHSGQVRFDDDATVDGLSRKQLARRLTMLTQMRTTPHGMRVRSAVELGRHPFTGWWGKGDTVGAQKIQAAMELADVEDLAHLPLEQLSGGQLQRVWLASCLAQDTEVLLLDEPTNHLDLKYQVELLELLFELAHEHGVCVGVVLHDLNHAATIADTVAVMSNGRVVAAGPPHDVLRSELLSEVYGTEITCEHDAGTVRISTRSPRTRASLSKGTL